MFQSDLDIGKVYTVYFDKNRITCSNGWMSVTKIVSVFNALKITVPDK